VVYSGDEDDKPVEPGRCVAAQSHVWLVLVAGTMSAASVRRVREGSR